MAGSTTKSCPGCEVENPPGAKYCLACGAAFPRACAACGAEIPADAKFCMNCGQPLAPRPNPPPIERQEPAPRPDRPAPRAPRHLAERVLQKRRAIEGERKAVTVLFVDIKGSTDLIEHRDPEEAQQILEPALQAMIDAVHRFDGIVSKVMGDGLMALFGAPLALEDHAVRACYSALSMREALRESSARLRKEHGVELEIRVGLHSGEVVVLSVGTDLHMEYDAIGATVNLAARMEQMAPAGGIRVTAETARLVSERMILEDLGPVPVRGFSDPLRVYELTGIRDSRGQGEPETAAIPLIGRASELEVISEIARRASERGEGGAVLIVGEAGIGKSRLCLEAATRLRSSGWLVLTARSSPYETGQPWLIGGRILHSRFGAGHDAETANRVSECLHSAGLTAAIPGLFEILGWETDDREWCSLKPEQRRRRMIDACRGWLLAESRAKPVMLLIDDLQWADSESASLLREMLDLVGASPVLMLLAARSDHVPAWTDRKVLTPLHLRPLALSESATMLDQLLGTRHDVDDLKKQLVERAGGNPLFLGEMVRALNDSGALIETAHGSSATAAVAVKSLPATVHAIVAARIDDLQPQDKALLHAAAVIGGTFELDLLSDVVNADIDDVRIGLSRLQARSFVYERQIFPAVVFAFQHPLVAEVAYRGLLKEQRRKLHSAIHDRLAAESSLDNPAASARLAHHAYEAELWDRAVQHYRAAAREAAARSAYEGAAALFRKGLDALVRLPGDARLIEGIDLRLELRHVLFPLGQFSEIGAILSEAKNAAEAVNDRARLGAVLTYLTAHHLGAGRFEEAIVSGHEALAIAEQTEDGALAVNALFYLIQAHASHGDYEQAAELSKALISYPGSNASETTVLSLARLWLVWCTAELGTFDTARAFAETALATARESDDPLAMLLAHLARGLVSVLQDRPEEAVLWLEIARSFSERPALRAWARAVGSPLGRALSKLGRIDEAISLLERVVAETTSARGSGHALRIVYLGEAYLRAGRSGDASNAAHKALDLARSNREIGHQAYALLLSAEVAAALGDTTTAIGHAQEALSIAAELKMKPLRDRAQHCLEGLIASGRPTSDAVPDGDLPDPR